MDDSLPIYLHDHLAGSRFAVELLEKLGSQFPSSETGRLALELLGEVQEDRRALEAIILTVGKISFDFHDALGWVAERASRLKLKHDDPVGIGAFEALETIALGLLGKRSLWEALSVLSVDDDRLAGPNYALLAERAQQQFAKANEYRLRLARAAFSKSSHQQRVL